MKAVEGDSRGIGERCIPSPGEGTSRRARNCVASGAQRLQIALRSSSARFLAHVVLFLRVLFCKRATEEAVFIIQPARTEAGYPGLDIPVTVERDAETSIAIEWSKDGLATGMIMITWEPDGSPQIEVACTVRSPDGTMKAARFGLRKPSMAGVAAGDPFTMFRMGGRNGCFAAPVVQ